MGSVFLKMLKDHDEFTAFSYDMSMGRIKANTVRLIPAGDGPIVKIHTDKGPYEMGVQQSVRMADHTTKRVEELKQGDAIHSCLLENNSGFIFARTGGRLVALHELAEVDMCGTSFQHTKFEPEKKLPAQVVVKVEPAGNSALFEIQVESKTADDMSAQSGHNLLLWPDGTSFGAGIFSY
jgi:hypothetical protein